MDNNDVLKRNEENWKDIVYREPESLALPKYGCMIDDESKMHLLSGLRGKSVLDVGCGSGQSLMWCGKRRANLWGIDPSQHQVEMTMRQLQNNGYRARIIASPLDQECGLPKDYFDVCYSVCTIGWCEDLDRVLALINSYLKPGGVFVFSWDHPFMYCCGKQGETLAFDRRYLSDDAFTFTKEGKQVTVQNRFMSTYSEALVKAGFVVDYFRNETDLMLLCKNRESNSDMADSEKELSPMSMVIKAHKQCLI